MSPQVLDIAAIRAALAGLPGWTGDQSGLNKQLKFASFMSAMEFMQACIPEIERLNHHPVWTNKYNTVEIHLDTFDAGHRVTDLDVELARAMERVIQRQAAG
jgi:4a-hydroxytetrahydrobiopterin dehydratase